MGGTKLVVALALIAACRSKSEPSKQAPSPKGLDGAVTIAFGDCSEKALTWISGPVPQKFADDDLGRVKNIDDSIDGRAPRIFASLSRTGDVAATEDTSGGGLAAIGGFSGFGTGAGGGGTGLGTIGTGRFGTLGRGTGGYGVGVGRGRDVALGQFDPGGGLDKDVISRVIKRSTGKIKDCYQKQLDREPQLSGKVTAKLTIGKDGSVESASADGMHPVVAACIANVVRTLEFPAPKGGAVVHVSYPFVFRSADDGAAGSAATAPPPPKQDEERIPPPSKDSDPIKDISPDARKQALKQAREFGMIGLLGKAEPPPENDITYQPGEKSPLRAVAAELEACFRLQPRRHAVAVFDLDGDKLSVLGIEHAEFADCVRELGPKLKHTGAPMRCGTAFGPMPVADAPAVEINETGVVFGATEVAKTAAIVEDPTPSWKITPVYDAARMRVREALTSRAPITLFGPLVIRAVDSAPMKVVNRAVQSVIAAGDDPVLAVKRSGQWYLLRKRELPVAPVPAGTGGSWSTDPTQLPARPADSDVTLSVLVRADKIWLGLAPAGELQEVAANRDALADALAERKQSAHFATRKDIEIAGADDVPYAKLVEAIETAEAVGFTQWTVRTREGLTARAMFTD